MNAAGDQDYAQLIDPSMQEELYKLEETVR